MSATKPHDRLRRHRTTRVPGTRPPDLQAATHGSRLALERVLVSPNSADDWWELAERYDVLAASWSSWTRTQLWYTAPVEAGLECAARCSWLVEVGCGSGQATTLLDEFASSIVATDVNASMLAHAPPLSRTRYLVADVRHLPFADASVPLIVGLNAVPHVDEFSRVLAPTGQLLWCTSFGTGTPLHVDTTRLIELLGDSWYAETGRAGHGDWVLLSRTG